MKQRRLLRSLKLRVLIFAGGSIGLALILVWLLLTRLFDQQISNRFFTEIEADLTQLARVIEPTKDGGAEVTGQLGDRRFGRQFSGRYWQVYAGKGDKETVQTSRSLWDEEIELPESTAKPAKRMSPSRALAGDSSDGGQDLGRRSRIRWDRLHSTSAVKPPRDSPCSVQ